MKEIILLIDQAKAAGCKSIAVNLSDDEVVALQGLGYLVEKTASNVHEKTRSRYLAFGIIKQYTIIF